MADLESTLSATKAELEVAEVKVTELEAALDIVAEKQEEVAGLEEALDIVAQTHQQVAAQSWRQHWTLLHKHRSE